MIAGQSPRLFYTAANASEAVQNDAPSSTRSLIKNCPASPNSRQTVTQLHGTWR